MKRSTRAFGDRVLRSRKRLFAGSQYGQEQQFKHVRLTSIDVSITQENKIKFLDHCVEFNGKNQSEIKLGKFKKVNRNGVNFGELKKMRLVEDSHGEIDYVGQNKHVAAVYTRKRKRNVGETSSVKIETFDENHGFDKKCEKKYFRKKRRKARSYLEMGYYGKDVLCEGPIVFGSHCSSNISQFSCFVRSVLRYLRVANSFSWTQFSSFLLLDSNASIHTSTGVQSLQNSTCTMSHGFFKVFGSVHSIPFFTVNFNAIPSCFLYIHSNLLLKFAFIFYASVTHVTIHEDKVSSVDHSLDKVVKAKKARSLIRRVPRVSLINKSLQKNAQDDVEVSLVDKYLRKNLKGNVEGTVPVPVVREVNGYAEQEFVPFMLPESYISSRSDELTRTLEKSYAVYDMDSDDDQWLKSFNDERFGDNGCVSEDTFEKVIDAFERGMYNSPHDYSEAASAVNRCQELALKEVLEAAYSYWMAKRKKKRSPLIEVFQCYKRKIVRQNSTNAFQRKRRSSRGRGRPRYAEKQLNSQKANDQKVLEDSSKAYNNVHEAQEAAKRSDEAAILKRQHAQVLMAKADLAMFKATMALRIAEALATPGSGAALGLGG